MIRQRMDEDSDRLVALESVHCTRHPDRDREFLRRIPLLNWDVANRPIFR